MQTLLDSLLVLNSWVDGQLSCSALVIVAYPTNTFEWVTAE